MDLSHISCGCIFPMEADECNIDEHEGIKKPSSNLFKYSYKKKKNFKPNATRRPVNTRPMIEV